MPVTPFFTNYSSGNPAWFYSADAGVHYTSPATNSGQVAGPVGQERYRTFVNIPGGYSGTYAVTVSGDIYANNVNTNAQVWYDGIFLGNVVPLPGPMVFNIPAAPGFHTFELWIGGASGTGVTAPVVTATYANTLDTGGPALNAIPCSCCTTSLIPYENLGPELLTNGDFEQSTGIGATSSIGPGWQTDYVPCGPNIFAAPCGAATYAFFTTNAGQVTGGSVNGTRLGPFGTRGMAVNVSGNLTQDIIRWTNIPLVNGQKYRFKCMTGVIGFPFGVSVAVDGVAVAPITTPTTAGIWTPTKAEFVWTGTTGNHNVSARSNNPTAGGNDHAFDSFSLTSLDGPVFSMICDGNIVYYGINGNVVTPQNLFPLR